MSVLPQFLRKLLFLLCWLWSEELFTVNIGFHAFVIELLSPSLCGSQVLLEKSCRNQEMRSEAGLVSSGKDLGPGLGIPADLMVSLLNGFASILCFFASMYNVPVVHDVTYLITSVCASFSEVKAFTKYMLPRSMIHTSSFFCRHTSNRHTFILEGLCMNLGQATSPLKWYGHFYVWEQFCPRIFGWKVWRFHQGFRNAVPVLMETQL